MYSLLLSLALTGQIEIGVPPAPAADPAANLTSEPATSGTGESAEEMRAWLLARLIIDSSFDEKKAAEAQRLLSGMNSQQLNSLVAAYKERTAKPVNPPVSTTQDERALDEAKLNQQRAEAYRDHLKREYDRRILQGQMTQNLVYQNIVNNQMMMYRTNGPFTHGAFGAGPFGFGGLGYGVLNYGGFGYGAPMYGGAFFGAPGVW